MSGIANSLCILFVYIAVGHQTVNGADKTYLRNTIVNYFSNIRHELVNSTEKQRVRNFIQDQFESFGLETIVQEFNAIGIQEGTFYNIIGVLKGTRFGEATDKIIGVGAHYDTVKSSPGVDDNGSGVAAMLETARTIGKQNKAGITRNNTIIFVAFDLEESGLYGSSRFIADWLKPFLTKEYKSHDKLVPHGFIILDTILQYNNTQHSQLVPGLKLGFQFLFPEAYEHVAADNLTGDFLSTIYRANEDDKALAQTVYKQWGDQGQKAMQMEMFGLPKITQKTTLLLSSFLRSDHFNFWVASFPAVFLTDSANFRGIMQQCYHKLCDNVETLLTDENVDFLSKTTDTLVGTVDILSDSSDVWNKEEETAKEENKDWKESVTDGTENVTNETENVSNEAENVTDGTRNRADEPKWTESVTDSTGNVTENATSKEEDKTKWNDSNMASTRHLESMLFLIVAMLQLVQ